jgi:hypothetical protein
MRSSGSKIWEASTPEETKVSVSGRGTEASMVRTRSGRSSGRKTVEKVGGDVLTDKRCIHLRSASVRTYTFFTTGFPRFLSIRRARRLQAFDLPLLTNYSNPNYD